MTYYHFIGQLAPTKLRPARPPEVLTVENREQHRLEAERTFVYVYGDNDRRDDALRTKEGLSEKYGVKFQ